MKNTIASIVLSFSIFTAFSQIPNPGFENWTTQGFPSYANPNAWGTVNSSTAIIGILTVSKATASADVHSGSAAVKLETFYISFANETAPGVTVTGNINTGNRTITGGFPYTARPTKLIGWFKYAPVGGDTCLVEVTLWKRNGGTLVNVGEAAFETTATVGSYTRFDADITYFTADTPDSARILLSASSTSDPQEGSVMFVDDLEFVDCSSLSASVGIADVSCFGGNDGSVSASATGGTAPYSYLWDDGSATSSIQNLTAGGYCATVTDGNGCTSIACGNVSEPAEITINITTTDATTTGGNDGSAKASASGGTGSYTYSWSNGATTDSISGLTKAVYCVTVSDAILCTATACGNVSDPGCNTLMLSVIGTDVTTADGNDGSAEATVTGGTPAYTYLWNTVPPQTTDSISNLIAGNYCVTVTDSNSCNVTGCVAVSGIDCSGLTALLTTSDITTIGGSDGTASANASGGTAPYSYDWSTSDSAQNLTGLTAGSYCVTATDAVGCSVDACDDITEPSCFGFMVNVTTTDETAAGADDGTASATYTAGTSPVSYSWSNGDTTENISSLAPGNICVTATDAVGCVSTACDTVNAGSVGISDLETAGIRLFPNPASDAVTIELENVAEYRFRLFDAGGKMVDEGILNNRSSVIALAGFPSGNYLVELKNLSDGIIATGKLLKE